MWIKVKCLICRRYTFIFPEWNCNLFWTNFQYININYGNRHFLALNGTDTQSSKRRKTLHGGRRATPHRAASWHVLRKCVCRLGRIQVDVMLQNYCINNENMKFFSKNALYDVRIVKGCGWNSMCYWYPWYISRRSF